MGKSICKSHLLKGRAKPCCVQGNVLYPAGDLGNFPFAVARGCAGPERMNVSTSNRKNPSAALLNCKLELSQLGGYA